MNLEDILPSLLNSSYGASIFRSLSLFFDRLPIIVVDHCGLGELVKQQTIFGIPEGWRRNGKIFRVSNARFGF